MVEFVVFVGCPLGPIPLAARGLAAVLARVGLRAGGPPGAVGGALPAPFRGAGAGPNQTNATGQIHLIVHVCRLPGTGAVTAGLASPSDKADQLNES